MTTMAKTITILQHNVRNWNINKFAYYTTYQPIDPDIILLNEHGVTNNIQIAIFNYDVYQTNKKNECNDGVTIAIKKNIKHKLIDNFMQEFLALKVETTIGELIIGTAYLPPRRPYLPAMDFLKLINYNQPVYIIGDFNARHRIFGHKDNNTVGKGLHGLINSGKVIHLGPAFPTFIGHNNLTTPDRIFSNNIRPINTE